MPYEPKKSKGDLCFVHLPGQNHSCPRQNIFVLDKKFCPRLNSSYLLGKRIENDFLAMEKFCPWLKSHVPSISQAISKYALFQLRKNLFFGTKSTYLLVKWMENDFLAKDIIFSHLFWLFLLSSNGQKYFYIIVQYYTMYKSYSDGKMKFIHSKFVL